MIKLLKWWLQGMSMSFLGFFSWLTFIAIILNRETCEVYEFILSSIFILTVILIEPFLFSTSMHLYLDRLEKKLEDKEK